MTPEDAQNFAREFFEEALERDERERRDHRPTDPQGTAFAIECAGDEWREAIRDNTMSEAVAIADAFLSERGLPADKGADRYHEFLRYICRAMVEVCKIGAARTLGHYEVTPSDRLFAPVPQASQPRAAEMPEGLRLSEVFEKWSEERKPKKKTKLEFDRAIRRFIEANGDTSVERMTKAHVRGLKEALVRMPGRNSGGLSAASINKHLQALSAILSWAINNGLREGDNPVSGMSVADPEADREKRLPFSTDDLRAIFASPVFSRGDRPRGGGGEAAYWLPVLALYTGARLEELGQAFVGDLREDGGIVHLDLNTEGEGKRLKTRGSKRKLPLHREVLRLGFREYAAKLPQTGRIFPGLKQDSKGGWTGNWSKWFGRYLRDPIGITDTKKVFHSFRHTFKDACRAAQVPTEVHDRLTGHSDGTVASTYGGEFPWAVLAAEMDKISYRGLDIPPPAEAPREIAEAMSLGRTRQRRTRRGRRRPRGGMAMRTPAQVG